MTFWTNKCFEKFQKHYFLIKLLKELLFKNVIYVVIYVVKFNYKTISNNNKSKVTNM